MKSIAWLLLGASLAAADEVTLRNGNTLSGYVDERDDRVVIRTEHARIEIPRSDVARIDRTKGSTIQEYDERFKTADLSNPDDVARLLTWAESRKMTAQTGDLRQRLYRLKWDALQRDETGRKNPQAIYELASWARANALHDDVRTLLQEVIRLDPDHEEARRALGFQRYDGKWMTLSEIRQAMGLIEFEGEWMTPATKEAILTSRTLEKERKLLDEERRRLDAARREDELRRADLARQIDELNRARTLAPFQFGETDCTTPTIHIHCPEPPPARPPIKKKDEK